MLQAEFCIEVLYGESWGFLLHYNFWLKNMHTPLGRKCYEVLRRQLFSHCASRTLQVYPVARFILETIFISVFKMLKATASLTTAYIQGLENSIFLLFLFHFDISIILCLTIEPLGKTSNHKQECELTSGFTEGMKVIGPPLLSCLGQIPDVSSWLHLHRRQYNAVFYMALEESPQDTKHLYQERSLTVMDCF